MPYTNLVKFTILLLKVNYDYITLFDVYECVINPDKLEMRIKEGERLYQTEEYGLVTDSDYMGHHGDLDRFPFQQESATGEMKAPLSADLLRHPDQNRIPYSLVTETGGNRTTTPIHECKRAQLEAVKRWFYVVRCQSVGESHFLAGRVKSRV